MHSSAQTLSPEVFLQHETNSQQVANAGSALLRFGGQLLRLNLQIVLALMLLLRGFDGYLSSGFEIVCNERAHHNSPPLVSGRGWQSPRWQGLGTVSQARALGSGPSPNKLLSCAECSVLSGQSFKALVRLALHHGICHYRT